MFGPSKSLDKICLFPIFNLSSVDALRHSKTFVLTISVDHAEINTIACALFARMVAFVLRSRGLMVIFNLFDRIFCLGISLLVFLFFSSLNSFNSSRGSCYFYYAGGGFTLFGCNWFQSTTTNLSVERQRPHPYYWNLPRPCSSWFELHFHRRNIPEEFFYRQMRMSL